MKIYCYFGIFQIIIYMKVKRRITLAVIISIFSFFRIWAQPVVTPPDTGLPPPKEFHKSFHGRRMPEEHGPFNMLGMKISSSFDYENHLIIELFFNYGINPVTVTKDSIVITDKTGTLISIDDNALSFTKNIRGIRLSVPTNETQISIKIQGIGSFDNEIMRTVEIQNAQIDSRYHYVPQENIWKKF